jgi:hypothetical protein
MVEKTPKGNGNGNSDDEEDADLLEAEEAAKSRYVKIGDEEKKCGLYVLRGYDVDMRKPRIRPIEKTYKKTGQTNERIHLDLIAKQDLIDGKISERTIRWLDIGKLSYPDFQDMISVEKVQLLDIKRTGDGTGTRYKPSACRDEDALAAVKKYNDKLQKLQPRKLPSEDEDNDDASASS